MDIRQCLDSDRGPRVLEAAALPTEPQPLPNNSILSTIGHHSWRTIPSMMQFDNEPYRRSQ